MNLRRTKAIATILVLLVPLSVHLYSPQQSSDESKRDNQQQLRASSTVSEKEVDFREELLFLDRPVSPLSTSATKHISSSSTSTTKSLIFWKPLSSSYIPIGSLFVRLAEVLQRQSDSDEGDGRVVEMHLVKHATLDGALPAENSAAKSCPLIVLFGSFVVLHKAKNRSSEYKNRGSGDALPFLHCELVDVSAIRSQIQQVREQCSCCPIELLVHSQEGGCATRAAAVAGGLTVKSLLRDGLSETEQQETAAVLRVTLIGRVVGVDLWPVMGTAVQPTIIEELVLEALLYGTVTLDQPDATECLSSIHDVQSALLQSLTMLPRQQKDSSLVVENGIRSVCYAEVSHVKVAHEIAFLTAARPQFPSSAPAEPILDATDTEKVKIIMDSLKVLLPPLPNDDEDDIMWRQQNASLMLNRVIKEYIAHGTHLIASLDSWQRGERASAAAPSPSEGMCRVCGHQQLLVNAIHYGPRCNHTSLTPKEPSVGCVSFHRCPVCGNVQRSASKGSAPTSSGPSFLSSSETAAESGKIDDAVQPLASLMAVPAADWCAQYKSLLLELAASSDDRAAVLIITVIVQGDPSLQPSSGNVSCTLPMAKEAIPCMIFFETTASWRARRDEEGSSTNHPVLFLSGPLRLDSHVSLMQQLLPAERRNKKAPLHLVLPCPSDFSAAVERHAARVDPSFLAPLGYPSDDILVTEDRFVTIRMLELLASRLDRSLDRLLLLLRPPPTAECLAVFGGKETLNVSEEVGLSSKQTPSAKTKKRFIEEWMSRDMALAASGGRASGGSLHPSLLLTLPHQMVLQQARVDLAERWRSSLLATVLQSTFAFGVHSASLDRYIDLHDTIQVRTQLRFSLDLRVEKTVNESSNNNDRVTSSSVVGWDVFFHEWGQSSHCGSPWTAVIATLDEQQLFEVELDRHFTIHPNQKRSLCASRLFDLRLLVLFPKPMLVRMVGPREQITGCPFDQPFRHIPVVSRSSSAGSNTAFAMFENLVHADSNMRQQLLRQAPIYDDAVPCASSPFWVTHPLSRRKKFLQVTHVLNEEYFLPFWMTQHSPHFDKVVLIDYNSSDRTRELVYRFAPSSWAVARYPRPARFLAVENDNDVVAEENRLPDWWKMSITVMEHLLSTSFRARMRSHTYPCHAVPTYVVAGDDPLDAPQSVPGLRRWVPLAAQRLRTVEQGPRIIHSYGDNFMGRYILGRHLHLRRKNCRRPRLRNLPWAILVKFSFSPWPENQIRKATLRQMTANVTSGGGHHQWSWSEWNEERVRMRKDRRFGVSPLDWLRNDHHYTFRNAWQGEFFLLGNGSDYTSLPRQKTVGR